MSRPVVLDRVRLSVLRSLDERPASTPVFELPPLTEQARQPDALGNHGAVSGSHEYDVFISHASEDKEAVASPIAHALIQHGLTVWLDELVLKLGDSLSRRIEAGLARCRFGVVVLSPAFFAKEWPRRELEGLAARETAAGTKVILPVWHNVDRGFLLEHAPILADRLAVLTSGGLDDVTAKIIEVLEHVDEPAPSREHPVAEDTPNLDLVDRPARQTRAKPSGATNQPASTRRRPGRATALLTAMVVPIGFAASSLLDGGKGQEKPLSASASNSLLEVSVPADWRRTKPISTPAGFQLSNPLRLNATYSPVGTLLLGFEASATTSRALLPQDFLKRLPTTPRTELVRLGDASFFRYRRLRPKGSSSAETVYALRTTVGVLLAVCTLPRAAQGAVGRDCERIVGSVQLAEAKSLPIAPDSSYASSLRQVLLKLDGARAQPERQLTDAGRSATQASAAQRLASAYTEAAGALRKAAPGPAERSAHEGLLASVNKIAEGYKSMVRGARDDDATAFTQGSETVTSATRSLTRSIAGFAAFGYTLIERAH
jgi:TIR domain